jgi:hypothetical protein
MIVDEKNLQTAAPSLVWLRYLRPASAFTARSRMDEDEAISDGMPIRFRRRSLPAAA